MNWITRQWTRLKCWRKDHPFDRLLVSTKAVQFDSFQGDTDDDKMEAALAFARRHEGEHNVAIMMRRGETHLNRQQTLTSRVSIQGPGQGRVPLHGESMLLEQRTCQCGKRTPMTFIVGSLYEDLNEQ